MPGAGGTTAAAGSIGGAGGGAAAAALVVAMDCSSGGMPAILPAMANPVVTLPAGTVAPPPTVTGAMADAYMATTIRDAAWLAIPALERDVLLQEAQRWLKGLCPDPAAEGCCGDFATQWTEAVSELALALKLSPTAIITGGASAGGATGEVKKQQLGELSVEFFQAREGAVATQTSRYGPKAPLVLQRFGFLGDIIGCWLPAYGSNRAIPIERN